MKQNWPFCFMNQKHVRRIELYSTVDRSEGGGETSAASRPLALSTLRARTAEGRFQGR